MRLPSFRRQAPASLAESNFRLLLLGAGRGGTSLLAGVLDAHSELEIGFERFAVDMLLGKKVKPPRGGVFDARVDAFTEACIKEAARYPDQTWGNKITTEQLLALRAHNKDVDEPIDVVDAFFRRLDGVRVIFILRDGRTCVRSKMARTGQTLESACRLWLQSVEVYRYLAERHPDRHILKYEDLLAEPEATTSAMCDFLGIEYQPAMLAGGDNAKMLPEYRSQAFDTGKLSLDGVPDGCEARIHDGLVYAGYVGS